MRTTIRVSTWAVMMLLVGTAAAQKAPSTALPSGELFFTGKGGLPTALEKTYPGIVGALGLTQEQIAKLHEAVAETIGGADVRKAAGGTKGDPNVTEAQKEAYRKIVSEARAKLATAVAGILTDDQKLLVTRLQNTADEVHTQVRGDFAAEFTSAKGDAEKAAELQKQYVAKLAEEFARKLNGILTPDQFTAFEKAAAAQKAAAGNKPKGDGVKPPKIK